MENNNIIMTLKLLKQNKEYDIEVPTNITANELFHGLNEGFHLKQDGRDIDECYLNTENPIALLKGNKKISEYGLHNGTIIYFTR